MPLGSSKIIDQRLPKFTVSAYLQVMCFAECKQVMLKG